MGSAEAKLDDRYKQATTGGSHPGATVALQKQPLRSASQSGLSNPPSVGGVENAALAALAPGD